MRSPVFFSLVVLALLATACAEPVSPEPELLDDYPVYKAALEDPLVKQHSTRFVIEADARPYGETLTQATITGLKPETREDLASRIKTLKLDSTKLQVSTTIELVPRSELDAMLSFTAGTEEEVWKRFGEKYPGANGYLWISRVGYDKTQAQALVYISHFCGNFCGEGWAVMLSKTDGSWSVVDVQVVWTS
ncbi:MAG: hypothetical protein QM765_14250 [Myxococcales bacterium]